MHCSSDSVEGQKKDMVSVDYVSDQTVSKLTRTGVRQRVTYFEPFKYF